MKYRQIAHRLRLQRGSGKPHVESERPRHKKSGRYTDLDAAGQSTTTIDIPDDVTDDVAGLLRRGSIQELPAPVGKGAHRGEDPG